MGLKMTKKVAIKMKYRTGDLVQVIAGKDKGKKSKVLKVLRDTNRLVLEGINLAKVHVKPTKEDQGGVKVKEMPIDASNVLHIDPKVGLPTRVGYKILEDGKKVRYAKRSGEIINNA
jgi:large subunit ribosomal protein L24